MRLSPGRSGSNGDQRTYLWLVVGLLILVGVAAALVVAVLRVGDETTLSITALGLPGPGASRTGAPLATPARTVAPAPVTPVSAPPSPWAYAWFFAGAGQSADYANALTLFNPFEMPVSGSTAYVGEAGPTGQVTFTVQPGSRLSLAIPSTGPLGLRLSASGALYAERLSAGPGGGVVANGVRPSATWYLPMIETRLDFSDSVVLANFNTGQARVSLAIFSDSGITQTLVYTVAGSSRLSVPVTWVLAPSSSVQPGRPRGAQVRSDLSIVVEQVTLTEGGGLYGGTGVAELAKTWYLPEANTRAGFSTTLAVLNPGLVPARLTVTYLPEGKPPLIKSYLAGAFTPLRLNLNAEMPDAAVGVVIESDQPVAVQRVTLLSAGRGAHSSVGATATAREWFLPDVSTVAPAVTSLVILNPGASAAEVIAYLYGEDGRPPQKQVVQVAPSSRFTLALDRDVSPGLWSARVVSSQPVVVERVTYFQGLAGGISSMGSGK
jgi:hypothetical protein